MDVSLVVGTRDAFLSWADTVLGAALFCAIFFAGTMLADYVMVKVHYKTWEDANKAIESAPAAIVFGAYLYGPVLYLVFSGHTWEPLSGPSYVLSLKQAEEQAVNAFWQKYISDDGSYPDVSMVGTQVRVSLEVTGVRELRSGKDCNAAPDLIMIEAKDHKDRIWVFKWKYQTESSNPETGDTLHIGLELSSRTFQDGYVRIKELQTSA
jgi:hypothetical protein